MEDRRYFVHSAIDWRSFVREIYKKLTFRKHGGASTIEMQFVRTCTGYRERTFRRKLYEMILAWALLHRASKSEILRSYLQEAYFGANLRGIVRTSRSIYGKSPDDLNQEESFVLASMLVYPRPMVPSELWKNKVSRRAGYGLRLLAKIGPVALK